MMKKKIDEALKLLGQKPNNELKCVYCSKGAETWDHIMALVNSGEFSGYGHQLNNLVPCCKKCNSAKGNKPWKDFIILMNPDEVLQQVLIAKIEAYINFNAKTFEDLTDPDIDAEILKLKGIRDEVLQLFIVADAQAKVIRDKLTEKRNLACSRSQNT